MIHAKQTKKQYTARYYIMYRLSCYYPNVFGCSPFPHQFVCLFLPFVPSSHHKYLVECMCALPSLIYSGVWVLLVYFLEYGVDCMVPFCFFDPNHGYWFKIKILDCINIQHAELMYLWPAYMNCMLKCHINRVTQMGFVTFYSYVEEFSYGQKAYTGMASWQYWASLASLNWTAQ